MPIEFDWLQTEVQWQALVNTVITFGIHKRKEFWFHDQLNDDCLLKKGSSILWN
jgi:hypothetical protein